LMAALRTGEKSGIAHALGSLSEAILPAQGTNIYKSPTMKLSGLTTITSPQTFTRPWPSVNPPLRWRQISSWCP
jgi:hypothetical protein